MNMRPLALVCLAASLVLPSCFQLEVAAHAAYGQFTLDGDLGYVSGSSGANIEQDVESAFGLGDDQGVPHARVMVDTGVPVIAVSGFVFEEEGSGVLTANFGDSPLLTAGAAVDTEFEMSNVKLSYAFQIELGPVSVAPGIAVDYFDLDMSVRDQIGIANERVELNAPVPLAFVRAGVDVSIVSAFVEAGYIEIDIDDVDAKFLDLEAMLMVHPTSMIDLFVGYRHLALDAEGLIDGDSFDTDITLGGILIGGGLRF